MERERRPIVHVEPIGIDLELQPGETIIEAAWRYGYSWPTVCYGQAECTLCHVEVLSGDEHLTPVDDEEREVLEQRLPGAGRRDLTRIRSRVPSSGHRPRHRAQTRRPARRGVVAMTEKKCIDRTLRGGRSRRGARGPRSPAPPRPLAGGPGQRDRSLRSAAHLPRVVRADMARRLRLRAVEAEMNELPHWRVELDGQPVHFVRVPGQGPAPIPLVLTHGYPWSWWDYRKVIGPLADPASHGGDASDAFDVIVPSLPGYGFSTPMRRGGIGAKATAGLWVKLVREILGLGPFVTAGGDWGAVLSIMLETPVPRRPARRVRHAPELRARAMEPIRGVRVGRPRARRACLVRAGVAPRRRVRAGRSCAPTGTCPRRKPTRTPEPTRPSRPGRDHRRSSTLGRHGRRRRECVHASRS